MGDPQVAGKAGGATIAHRGWYCVEVEAVPGTNFVQFGNFERLARAGHSRIALQTQRN